MSYLQLGRSLFWFAVVLVVATTIVVIEPGYIVSSCSPLIQNPGTEFFGASLNLTLSIISLVFIVVIFLVQNANQEYSSRLSGVILREPHFLLTIVFILVGSVFSVSGGYFGLGAPFTLLSYAFSVASVLLVGALITFAAHFISVENIIEYVTEKIKSRISSSRIYQWRLLSLGSHDEEYIDQLTSQTQLLISTCIKAIEQNHEPVVDSCLSSLVQIAEKFVAETGAIEADDDYLQELNDQFRFITSSALNEYTRQKYAEKVAEAVGDIGTAVAKRRKLGTAGAHWAGLLKEIFVDSLSFDRTAAPHFCIKKLGEMSVAAIECGGDSFRNDCARSCVGKLSSISNVCLSNPSVYTASLTGNICVQYQKIYCSYFSAICMGKSVDVYDIKNVLGKLSYTLLESKQTYSGPTKKQSVFSSVFGLDSFSGRILSSVSGHEGEIKSKINMLESCLSKIPSAMKKISCISVCKNYRLIYQGYTQLAFAFSKVQRVMNKIEALKSLNNARLTMLEKEYEHSFEEKEHIGHHLNGETSDYNAILVYFYKDHCSTLIELFEPLAKLYLGIDQKYDRNNQYVDKNLQKLYGQLKLSGAWISRYCDVEAEAPKLWHVLVKDFSDVGNRSPIPGSPMADYGYPTKPSSPGGGWWLRPDELWAYTGFQEEIARELNGEKGEVYFQFHNLLKQNQS
jgi:hypothetical protein